MGMFEEPLQDAIVRAHHDPDPIRAFRYRPFFYASGSALPAEHGGAATAGLRRTWRPARLRFALRAPRLTPAPAPCCATPCC